MIYRCIISSGHVNDTVLFCNDQFIILFTISSLKFLDQLVLPLLERYIFSNRLTKFFYFKEYQQCMQENKFLNKYITSFMVQNTYHNIKPTIKITILDIMYHGNGYRNGSNLITYFKHKLIYTLINLMCSSIGAPII